MSEIKIILNHAPISVNEMYSNSSFSGKTFAGKKVRGRSKTTVYKVWQNNAGYEILAQRSQWPIKNISGYFMVSAAWPFHEMRDLDNYWKALFDTLQNMKIIDNDRKCIGQSSFKARNLNQSVIILRPATDEDVEAELVRHGLVI